MPFTVFNSIGEWATAFGDSLRSAVTVGNFDGLHLGHQKILRLVREHAHRKGQRAAAITFDPHPLKVLHPDRAPAMIQTLEQRLAGFAELGIEAALVLRFDRELSLVSPHDFVERILVGGMRAGSVLVGDNFHFGHRGAGDVRMLREFGSRYGFEVEIVPPVEVAGQVVSSTGVRSAVAGGEVRAAAAMLGRPFSLTGTVRSGAGRGRTILFPTLNLVPAQELLPKLGVYATESLVAGRTHESVTNVGVRPTFDESGVTVESHLFGFADAISGGPMEVRFHTRIRDERKFPGPEALRAQISADIDAAQRFFAERNVVNKGSR